MQSHPWYKIRYSQFVLSFRTCAWLFAASLLAGALGYAIIEGYSAVEALYMAVITISTVGFAEVKPLSDAGRLFTAIYVILNLGISALFISQLTQSLTEGGVLIQLRRLLMDREIRDLHDHVIVCGCGRYGREVLENLYESEEDVVLVEVDEKRIERSLKAHPHLAYVKGNATSDKVLLEAGIERAKTLIVTVGDDRDNAFTVLTAKQLAPKVCIIARVYAEENRAKLQRVGADYVVQPEQLGGFMMATLVRKPSAVEFFTSLAQGPSAEVGFEEVSFRQLPPKLRDCSLLDLDLRRQTGASIIALRHADGTYVVNPHPDTAVSEGSSFIALGNKVQLDKLRGYIRYEEQS